MTFLWLRYSRWKRVCFGQHLKQSISPDVFGMFWNIVFSCVESVLKHSLLLIGSNFNVELVLLMWYFHLVTLYCSFIKMRSQEKKKLELHLCLLHIFWYDKISYKMVQISIMWNNKWTNITSSWWGRVYNPATKSPAWAGDRGWVFLLCITPKTQAGRLTLHVLTSPWSHFDAPVGCLSCFLHCLESH